jgi:hypothetical protein
MQNLEALLASLNITQHMTPLSNFRDNLIRENAAALQAIGIAKDAEKQAALDALRVELTPIDSAE